MPAVAHGAKAQFQVAVAQQSRRPETKLGQESTPDLARTDDAYVDDEGTRHRAQRRGR
jgi:hypothetical protein